MIDTLALFLSPGERYCSRYANVEKKYVFHMDLYLQGIIDVSYTVSRIYFFLTIKLAVDQLQL